MTTLAAAETARSSESSVCARPPHVEHHRGAVLPWHLVLAHHQLVVAGRRRPVDAAQVVADHVLAERVELVALAADRAVVHDVAERIAVAAARRGSDDVDVREDGELEPGCARAPLPGQTERVGDLHRERADGDDTAVLGRQPVRGAGPLGVTERHEVEPGASGAGHRVAEGQDRGAAGAGVRRRDLHAGGVVGVDPGGRERPPHSQVRRHRAGRR